MSVRLFRQTSANVLSELLFDHFRLEICYLLLVYLYFACPFVPFPKEPKQQIDSGWFSSSIRVPLSIFNWHFRLVVRCCRCYFSSLPYYFLCCCCFFFFGKISVVGFWLRTMSPLIYLMHFFDCVVNSRRSHFALFHSHSRFPTNNNQTVCTRNHFQHYRMLGVLGTGQ